jgi:phycoerythrin-associated linker protein
MKSQLSPKLANSGSALPATAKTLPPIAQKKIQGWMRSRHLICSGNFFVFETVDYGAVERFVDYIQALGGAVISVDPIDKIWMGDHRQVILYQAKASLHTPPPRFKAILAEIRQLSHPVRSRSAN